MSALDSRQMQMKGNDETAAKGACLNLRIHFRNCSSQTGIQEERDIRWGTNKRSDTGTELEKFSCRSRWQLHPMGGTWCDCSLPSFRHCRRMLCWLECEEHAKRFKCPSAAGGTWWKITGNSPVFLMWVKHEALQGEDRRGCFVFSYLQLFQLLLLSDTWSKYWVVSNVSLTPSKPTEISGHDSLAHLAQYCLCCPYA